MGLEMIKILTHRALSVVNNHAMTSQHTKTPRLYCPSVLAEGGEVELSPAQAHYLKNVMRRSIGDNVRVFNAENGEWQAQISALSGKKICVIPEILLKAVEAQGYERHLLFCPIKKNHMDVLIEKSVELGATHLWPVISDHTEIRKLNRERIEAQIVEAAEQCERLDMPTLQDIQPLVKILATFDKEVPLYAALERSDKTQPFADAYERDRPAAFLIGPEGGWSAGEQERIIKASHVLPVSLGPRILRAETAAFYMLSHSF